MPQDRLEEVGEDEVIKELLPTPSERAKLGKELAKILREGKPLSDAQASFLPMLNTRVAA